ncbi:hypothetical protein KIW84_021507 [Lathyrus oleraceus]|uniref:Uncharacterized protein n=1 Tax=Pisum sativum TaxID=3888 RepID=A0A9D5B430_PEA|nr:hypothetical protein KIW84_021507 [Pisum sativum]
MSASLLGFATTNQENISGEDDLKTRSTKKVKGKDHSMQSFMQSVIRMHHGEVDLVDEGNTSKSLKIEEKKSGEYEYPECILSEIEERRLTEPWKWGVLVKMLRRRIRVLSFIRNRIGKTIKVDINTLAQKRGKHYTKDCMEKRQGMIDGEKHGIKERIKEGKRGKGKNNLEKLMEENGVNDLIKGLNLERAQTVGNSSGNEVYAEPYTWKGTLLDQLGPKNIRAQGSMEEEREEVEEIILEVID